MLEDGLVEWLLSNVIGWSIVYNIILEFVIVKERQKLSKIFLKKNCCQPLLFLGNYSMLHNAIICVCEKHQTTFVFHLGVCSLKEGLLNPNLVRYILCICLWCLPWVRYIYVVANVV